MPSFYTSGVAEGTVTDVKDYLKTAARALGAFMHMKEDDTDSEIRHRTINSSYFDRVKKAEDYIKDVSSWDHDRIVAEQRREKQEEIEWIESRLKERAKLRERYDAMELKVIDASHLIPNELISFALNQLRESRQHDCDDSYDNERYTALVTDETSPAEWYATKLANANSALQANRKYLIEEQDRVAESNKWINKVIDGLEKIK